MVRTEPSLQLLGLCTLAIFASIITHGGTCDDEEHHHDKRFLLDDDPNATPATGPVKRFVLVIDVSKSLSVTQPTFVSLNIDSNQIRKEMSDFEFGSKKLVNMAAAFSPTYIRLGGTYADFLHFDPNNVWGSRFSGADDDGDDLDSDIAEPVNSKYYNFTMSTELWDNITRFCDEAGWGIMWDFNLFFWKEDGTWDPTQAIEFLKYNAARGVKIPSFQLGNEPNAFFHNFGFRIEPDMLVRDFQILRDVVSEFPEYNAGGFYGPEVINLDRHGSARQYLDKFLKAGGCDVVNEIGLHHYYLDGKTAQAKDFLDPKVMDTLITQIEYSYNITWGACKVRKPIRLTETSSAYGGGATGLSDAYAAGFLWLDKLGLCAKHGITHVFRQTFYGGRYSLVDYDMNVHPDFWLTLLFKRLVEGPVFHVVTAETSPNLRLYAHCVSKRHYNYPDGAMVVYYLNLAREQVHLSLSDYSNAEMHLYMLTAGDGHGLHSSRIKLNGQVLYMNGSQVPDFAPKSHSGDIPITEESYGFIVIPQAKVPLCKIYHRYVEKSRRRR